MSGFDKWQDRLVAGEKPSVENFAATALTDLPRVTIRPRRLDFRAWGFKSQAEMDAAFEGDAP